MILNFLRKQAIVNEISKVAKNALSAVIADLRGITVNKINELRKTGREAEIYIRVVRNTLLSRAIEDTDFKCLQNMLIGPTLIAFSTKHPGTAARLFKEFSRSNTTFKIKIAAFRGELIAASRIDYLATLPTYKEAISRLITVMREASFSNLIRVLSAIRDIKKDD